MQQQQSSRSQSVSRSAEPSYGGGRPQTQVSFLRQQQAPPPPPPSSARRAQSSLRPRLASTPRHYPLSMPNGAGGAGSGAAPSPRAASTGRAGATAGGAAFTLDYDDPEEVTRAILRLREQREREAAERSASRSKSSGRSRGGESAARQRHALQPAVALQKSQSQGSSQSGRPSQPQGHAARTRQMYRAPSPSLAMRQAHDGSTGAPPPPQPSSAQLALQRSSSSTENHYQSPGQGIRKTASRAEPEDRPGTRGGPSATAAAPPPPPTTTTRSPNLQQAERRIDGLLAELEELRFFEELDNNGPAPPADANAAGATKGLGAMPTATPTNAAAAAGPRVPQLIGVPAVSSGDGTPRNATAHKLPPPPVNLLDPRQIGKLDRHSLELETQTLVRSVQLLTSEKLAIEAEMEVLATEQGRNRQRIQQLEQALAQVKQQLAQARKEMNDVRLTTVQQYESRLSENVEKLQQTQQVVDDLKVEREKLQTDLEARMVQVNELKLRTKNELREERDAAQAREAVLELQLAEVTNTVESLKIKMKEKEKEVNDLRRQVGKAEQTLYAARSQQDSAHEAQLKALQEQVSMTEMKYELAVEEQKLVEEQLVGHQNQLKNLKQQLKEQAAQIADLTNKLDQVHSDYRQKLVELKENYEAKEKRRLNEMVIGQSKQVEEYERRLLSMQQQLTMATDRHYTEIRQKDADMEQRLEKERKKVREQLEDEHRRATEKLRYDFDVTKRNFEEAESDRQRLLKVMAAPNTEFLDAQRSWEEKNVRQQQEIEHLKKQIERWSRDSSDKESKILDLTMKLTDRSKKHEELLNEVDSRHAASLMEREETIVEQKRAIRELQLTARNELSQKEAEWREMKRHFESRISELEQLLSTKESECKSHEDAVAQMKSEVELLKNKFDLNETALKEKHDIISDLEERLKHDSEENTLILRETQQQFESLNQKLKEQQSLLAQERLQIEKQNVKMAHLERQKQELLAASERSDAINAELQDKISGLEKVVKDMESTSKELVSNNEALQSKLSELGAEKEALEGKVVELVDNEEILRQENDELQDSCDAIEANIRKLRQVKEELEEKALKMLPAAEAELLELKDKLAYEQGEKYRVISELATVKQELETCHQQMTEYVGKINEAGNVTNDLETQTRKSVEELQAKLDAEQTERANLHAQLGTAHHDLSIFKIEAGKVSDLELEITNLSRNRDDLSSKLDELKVQLEEKSNLIEKLEKQLQDAVAAESEDVQKRSSFDIDILEEEVSELRAVSDRQEKQIHHMETELELKSMQVAELRDHHSKEVEAFEEHIAELTSLKDMTDSRVRVLEADLTAKAEQLESLEKKIFELSGHDDEMTRQNEELKSKLHRTELELKDYEKRLDEMAHQSDFTTKLRCEVEQLTKLKASLEVQLRDIQEEQNERERHVQQSAEKFSNQIVELQMKVEDLTAARTSLRTKLAEAEAELDKKEDILRSSQTLHSTDLNRLHQHLAEQLEVKNRLESQIAELESNIASERRNSEMAAKQSLEDLQAKVDAASKENRSLKLRIGDAEQELERKEKQIKEVVNRYSQEVAALSDKLEVQTKESRALQKELDHVKTNVSSVSDVSNEADTLRERVASLEKAIDVERALTRDADKARKRIEKEMSVIESGRKDLQERFEKVSSERNEVIAALEEVIHEVQSREDEIDALADALRRREDELQHARMIASKALSSAQEIKARYQEKNPGPDTARNTELEDQVASLTAALGQMKKSNNSLQRKLARLEEELTKKEGEYSELKERIHISAVSPTSRKLDIYVAEKDFPDEPPACSQNGSASTVASTASGGTNLLDSPSRSLAFTETMSDVGASSDTWGMQPSGTTSTDSGEASVSFPDVRAEPGDRKAMERNALRKYVRRRYMSARSTSST